MPTPKDLHDAFYETLKDVYFTEKQSVKACKKSAKNAQAPELKAAFEEHAEVSEHQIERLEEVFATIGKPSRAKTCEAMNGIVAEMQEDVEDFGGTSAGDSVIIGCAQAIEHYEIARYGLLKTWAEQLGNPKAAKLLGETLAEETATDKKLSTLAARLTRRPSKAFASSVRSALTEPR